MYPPSNESIEKWAVNQNTLIKAKDFLNKLELKVSPKIFLSAFIVSSDPNNFDNELYYAALKVNQACRIDSPDKKKLIEDFSKLFKIWSSKDKASTTMELIKSYHQLTVMQMNNSDETIKQNLQEKKEEIKQMIFGISGRDGIIQLLQTKPVVMDSSIAEKAYWDVLKEEIAENPPKLVMLSKLLKQVKENILAIIPENTYLKSAFEEEFDLTIFQQLVDSNNLDAKYIGNLCLYLIDTIQKLQSASEDQDSLKWKEYTQSYFNGNVKESLADFLSVFFKKVIKKVGTIQQQIVNLNKKK